MAKGIEKPIWILIVLIIAVVALIAILAVYFGIWTPSTTFLNDRAAFTLGCQKLLSLGGETCAYAAWNTIEIDGYKPCAAHSTKVGPKGFGTLGAVADCLGYDGSTQEGLNRILRDCGCKV